MDNRLAACHILASLQIRPHHLHMAYESASFTYVSHLIKELKRRRKVSKLRRHTTCAWIFRSLGTGLTTIDPSPSILRVMHSSRHTDLDSMTWPRKLSVSPPPLLVAILHECILEATSRVDARVVTIHVSMEDRTVDAQFIRAGGHGRDRHDQTMAQ